jgi:aminoglycoside/choline kinase family phosphotransferase
VTPTKEARPAATVERLLRRRFGPARRVERLAADASVRQFWRIERTAGGTAVACVDPHGGTAALDRMQAAGRLLRSIGVPVAEILDRDDRIPALLLEDLGDWLLADALRAQTDAERRSLYAEAGRIAGRIARLGTPEVKIEHPLAWPMLARERLRMELAFFTVHDVAGRRGVHDEGLLKSLAVLSDTIVEHATARPLALAHRDFHARNLLVRPGPALGVVDYQDALLAPVYYDLVSLVRDPYVVPDAALAAEAVRAFSEETGAAAPEQEPLFAWVALQRDLKAIGTYAFQALRLGRERFTQYIPAAERLALRAAQEIGGDAGRDAAALLLRIGFADDRRTAPA